MCLFTRTLMYNITMHRHWAKGFEVLFNLSKSRKDEIDNIEKFFRRSWKSVKSFCMPTQENWKLIEPCPNIQLTNQSDMIFFYYYLLFLSRIQMMYNSLCTVPILCLNLISKCFAFRLFIVFIWSEIHSKRINESSLFFFFGFYNFEMFTVLLIVGQK